ncbi:MAG: glutamine amidotransferase, partial [Nitrospinales bacterium]
MMIGGDLSFQGGEYERTAVEDILPVRIQNKSKQFLQEEFQAQMDKRFVRHPILRLEKNEGLNEEAWTSLPKLSGLNIGLVPAKDAQVLIGYSKEENSEASYPVLAIRRSGEGRALVLTTDSSWNWNFLRVGKGGSGRYYQKFWDNVIAWMTKAPETDLIKIESDKERYGESDKVLIKIKILQDDYNPLPDEKIDLVFHSFSKRKDVSSHALETDESGEAAFEFVPPSAGFYSARVERNDQGERLGRETRFSVFSPTTEFDKPRVNSLLLQAMAKATAGEYTVLNEQTDLSPRQFPNPEIQAKSKSMTLSLWDNWWSYGMIVAFLFVDWWMRRRSGLS